MTVPGHVAVRLDAETVERIDALVPGLSTAWHTAKRSDALRYAILEGLAAIDARAPSKPRRPRRSSRGAAR